MLNHAKDSYSSVTRRWKDGSLSCREKDNIYGSGFIRRQDIHYLFAALSDISVAAATLGFMKAPTSSSLDIAGEVDPP